MLILAVSSPELAAETRWAQHLDRDPGRHRFQRAGARSRSRTCTPSDAYGRSPGPRPRCSARSRRPWPIGLRRTKRWRPGSGWTDDIDREISAASAAGRGPPRRAAPSTPGRCTTGTGPRPAALGGRPPRPLPGRGADAARARSSRRPRATGGRSGARPARELRRAFAVVLDDLADGAPRARRRARRAALAARSPRPTLPRRVRGGGWPRSSGSPGPC